MSLPDVLITTGSLYATEINNAFLTLDSIVGQGFIPSQLNINQDLPFQGNNATQLRSARFNNQTSSLSTAQDVNELYFQNGNLYVVDVSGNQIQITSNGTMNAPGGNIQGLAGTSAGIVYSAGSTTFQFTINTSSLTVANAANISANNATLYGKLWSTGSSGVYFDQGINANTNATGSLRMYALGPIVLSSSGIFNLNTTNTATNQSMLSMSGDINAQGGFRHCLTIGYYAATLTNSLSNQTCAYTTANTNNQWSWVAPYQGSVVGMSAWYPAQTTVSATAGSASYGIFKNGAPTGCYINVGSVNSASVTFAKDQFTFNPGDRLTILVSTTATWNQSTFLLQVMPVVEM